ncbi:MAG: hypothetical protein ABI443_12500, partial [Chthoniobacterales bacterium]
KIIAGGTIYITGAQQSFMEEALCRSGGTILSLYLSASVKIKPTDVVLAGWVKAKDAPAALALIDNALANGAQVILFSNTYRPDKKGLTIFPTTVPKAPAIEPSVESVSNILGMWTWTGQFITACIKQGKMPTMYESMSMPGAAQRNAMFRNSSFHDQNIPIHGKVPDLGKDYLKAVSEALHQLKEKNGDAFKSAVDLVRSSHENNKDITILSLSHMFPAEIQSNELPKWITAAAPKTEPTAASLPIYIGYQWTPWESPALTGKDRIPSILTTSRPPTADWVQDKEHIYIDPCWEAQDAAVKLPGYDINILPISGVMQSTIFWEIMEKASR